jgi:hypothetical protein
MAKDFYILRDGKRTLYEPGHYEVEDARSLARNEAKRNPGHEFAVVEVLDRYLVEKK